MLNVSVMCFFASYLLALAFEVVRFYRRSTLVEVLHLAMTAAGLVAQTLYLGLRSRQTHLPPLLSSFSDWLLVLAWLVVLLYLIFVLSDRTFRAGILVLPLVMALIVAAWVGGAPQVHARRRWFRRTGSCSTSRCWFSEPRPF